MFETGVGIRNPLFFIGVVENIDGRLEGRVQVRAFGIHGTVQQVPTEALPWATLIHGSYDTNAPLPPINSFVFGFFLDGRDAQQPMILGIIPTQMTEIIDPDITGWGRIPERNANLLAKGSRPVDYGQPDRSRLARGENIEETYVLNQEMGRIKKVKIAGGKAGEQDSWEEPASAYNAEYPFNRVIETASGHSIELDDTPGSERIMIYHKTGSFVQIDSNGTTVHKSTGDKYEVNDRNHHLYVGGRSLVTIEGDCHVLVNGNKTEEVTGDLIQLIHGNHMLSVGGQSNLNASDEVQIRAAKLRIESNVEGINIKGAKNIRIESGESTHMKSGIAIFQDAKNSVNLIAGDNIFTQAGGSYNVKSDTMFFEAAGAGDFKAQHAKIGGGSKVSISASIVAIDDIVQMAEGSSTAPASPGEVTAADSAETTELPEPTSKSASTTQHKNTSSSGSAGYSSRDDGLLDTTITSSTPGVLV